MVKKSHVLAAIKTLLIIMAVVFIILSAISIVAGQFWIGSLLSNFRVQYTILFAILAMLLWVARRYFIASICVIMMIINVSYILPYYWQHPSATKTNAKASVRIMTMNVLYHNRHYALIKKAILQSKAQVIALEEVSSQLARYLQRVKSLYPYRVVSKRYAKTRIMVLSKIPLQQQSVIAIGKRKIAGIKVRFRVHKKMLTLIAVHLHNPVKQQRFYDRNSELKDLSKIMQRIENPKILVGDFNLTPWCYYFRQFIKHSGMHDSMLGYGVHTTWLRHLFSLSLTIDHIFISKDIAVKRRKIGDYIGSDHYPVIVDLQL